VGREERYRERRKKREGGKERYRLSGCVRLRQGNWAGGYDASLILQEHKNSAVQYSTVQ
jgi:hypothetical protein